MWQKSVHVDEGLNKEAVCGICKGTLYWIEYLGIAEALQEFSLKFPLFFGCVVCFHICSCTCAQYICALSNAT